MEKGLRECCRSIRIGKIILKKDNVDDWKGESNEWAKLTLKNLDEGSSYRILFTTTLYEGN